MNFKRFFKKRAEQDSQQILESEESQSLLRGLIEREQSKETQPAENRPQCITCPDCGNALLFNPTFGRFMHENSEQANCWYAANELGECVDNNEMRAERIAKFSGFKI